MPDDHSEVVPLLPIPNRTVKRLCADDSADSRVKVGHRQALTTETPRRKRRGVLISTHRQSCRRVLMRTPKSVLECESSQTTRAEAIAAASKASELQKS